MGLELREQVEIVSGVGAPSIVSGTKTVSGDNALIAAPGAGVRIVVSAVTIQNESATPTTMVLKSGSTAKFRWLEQAQGDGLVLNFAPGREWRLGTNEALNLNLSGANSCGYNVVYWTETV